MRRKDKQPAPEEKKPTYGELWEAKERELANARQRAILSRKLSERLNALKKEEKEMTDTFTRQELADAIENIRSQNTLITDTAIVNRILAARSLKAIVKATLPTEITATELRVALDSILRKSSVTSPPNVFLPALVYQTADDVADAVLKHAKDSREPEYKTGDVVRDGRGQFYRNVSPDTWQQFGTVSHVKTSVLGRPLTLVK